jgi:hypothetical protein
MKNGGHVTAFTPAILYAVVAPQPAPSQVHIDQTVEGGESLAATLLWFERAGKRTVTPELRIKSES